MMKQSDLHGSMLRSVLCRSKRVSLPELYDLDEVWKIIFPIWKATWWKVSSTCLISLCVRYFRVL